MAIIHRTTRLQKSRFLRLVLGCNIEGNPLFPYGFHNENINRCWHTHPCRTTKLFKFFLQILIQTDANRRLCHCIHSYFLLTRCLIITLCFFIKPLPWCAMPFSGPGLTFKPVRYFPILAISSPKCKVPPQWTIFDRFRYNFIIWIHVIPNNSSPNNFLLLINK